MTDLIIIGGGPAGISAALYALRANLKVLVLENGPNALAKAHQIDNYYGHAASGTDMYSAGLKQAAALGAEIIHDEVFSVEYTGNFSVHTKTAAYEAPAVILATGTKQVRVNIDGIARLEGKGVSYCAVCDGFFFRGKKVAILGSGAYALHEAEYLKHLAAGVTILTNGGDDALSKAAGFATDSRRILSVNGEAKISSITFADGNVESFDGLFVALGTADSSDLARKLGAEINGRFVQIKADCATNIPGLFAAGDCTGGLLQVVKAAHEGAVAATSAIRFLRKK